MSVKKIKKILIDKEITVKSLSEKTGFSRGHISNVINGHFEAPKTRQAISKVLGIDHDKLWGEQKKRAGASA